MQRRWSKAEIAYLKKHAASSSPEELAQKFHTDADTVARKLDELGLNQTGSDEALAHYVKATELMHAGQWPEAATVFESVVEEADNHQLADRARQNLRVCQQHTETDVDGVDPYLRAVYEKNRGNVEKALEICLAEGKQADDERFTYLLASLEALTGKNEEAMEHLESAIRLEPKNRVHAYHDPDFADLRGQEEFTDLIGPPSPSTSTPSES